MSLEDEQATMHLSRFKIVDFQSYLARDVEQELRLDRHITILAGRNNVGKTALLRGLRLPVEERPGIGDKFYAEYVWQVTHAELTVAMPDVIDALRAVSISQSRPHYQLWARFGLTAPFGQVNNVTGNAVPWFGRLLLLESGIADTNLRITLQSWGSGQGSGRLWWQDLAVPDAEPWQSLASEWVGLIRAFLSSAYYVHPRRYGTNPEQLGATEHLLPDGSNLTQVVATLASNHRRTTFSALQSFIRSSFPEIADIDARVQGSPAVATLHVVYNSPSAGEWSVPLEHCGTGIEQMLMLGTVLLTSEKPRLFLIDEPHAFLHPAAERSLLRLIEDHPEHQYVIATHSGVFLNAVSLDHVRLITIDGSGSHINDVRHASDILTAVGVTAADLWSADALLWIEGPSDVKAVEELIALTPDLREVSIRVLAMPDWIRSLSASEKNAQAAVRFCEAVREAVTPFKVPSLFLFDADEKKDALKAGIEVATGTRARFLPVRELENLFLVPAAVQQVLATLCEQVDRPVPSIEEVAEEIGRMLAETNNRQLYKTDPGDTDPAKVVGSALLGQLWWKWATAGYDKVAYGPDLVVSVNAHDPEKLEPLRSLLRELAEMVRTTRAEA